MRIMNSILARIIAGSVLWIALSPLVPAAEKAPVATAARAPGAAAKANWLERALQPGGSPLGQPCKEYLTANGLPFKTDPINPVKLAVKQGSRIHPLIAYADFDCLNGAIDSADFRSKVYKGTNAEQVVTKLMEQVIDSLHLSKFGWSLAASGKNVDGGAGEMNIEARIYKHGEETITFRIQHGIRGGADDFRLDISLSGSSELWSENNWFATLIRTGEFPKGLECDKVVIYDTDSIPLPNRPDEWPSAHFHLSIAKRDFSCVDGVIRKFVLTFGVSGFQPDPVTVVRQWSDTNIARLRLKENGWRLVYQDPPGKSRLGGLTIAARAFQKGDKTILWEERYSNANPKDGVSAVITYPGRYPGQ